MNENVIYAGTHRARVLRFDPNADKVEIEFFEKDLIPPKMWASIQWVRKECGNLLVNPNTHCPPCGIPWKEVILARFSAWDCHSCGAKKEDYVS